MNLSCLIFQVTWLEGHSLAQTVFTNLYLHDPYIIEDRCLKAFSIGMLKIIDHIRDRVNRASVFEEVTFIQAITYLSHYVKDRVNRASVFEEVTLIQAITYLLIMLKIVSTELVCLKR